MKQKAFVAIAVLGLAAASCGDSDGSSPTSPDANANVNADANAQANGEANAQTDNAAPNAATPAISYWADIKPIIDARCVDCHRDGSIGPFALTNYDEVAAVAGLVKSQLVAGTMPPFIYDTQECRELAHDPSMTQDEIDAVIGWIDDGLAEGDPADEPEATEDVVEPPDFDTTLQMPVKYTPRQSPDDYRCFVVDWPHESRKYVTGFGVEPGEASIVHHVIAFLAPPTSVAEAEALDAAEEGPGYTCFGTANISDQSWIGSWAPGGVPMKYPANTGLPVQPGSKMIIQVHYNTLGTDAIPDQTTVNFETADAVTHPAFFMPWANIVWFNGAMRIPAGDSDVKHEFAYDPTQFSEFVPFFDRESYRIWGGGLHMHMLGTSIRLDVLRGDGEEQCLMNSPNWDFNWQTGVMFDEPITVNRGDRIKVECHWDNSMENQPLINGERVVPADRNWGEGTMDEMCLGLMYITE